MAHDPTRSDLLPDPTAQNTLVAVMSFNMAQTLGVAVDSMARHFPGAKIVVFDDASTNRRTLKVLDELRRRHEVVVNEHAPSGSALGGLHANMNMALERAEAEGYEYVFFLQDDQQVLRPLDAAWSAAAGAIFNTDPSIAQLETMFAMGWRGDEYYEREFQLHESRRFFEGRRGPDGRYLNPGMWGVCDNGIVSLARLRTHAFRYDAVEWVAMDRAAELGIFYVKDAYPATMFTPWPRTHRRRGHIRSSLGAIAARVLVRVNEIGVGAGRGHLEDLSPEAARRLQERDPAVIPYAEDYLTTDKRMKRPWYYRQSFDRKKLRGRHLLTLRWIFDGPEEYIRARSTVKVHAGDDAAEGAVRGFRRLVWTARQAGFFVRQPWRGRAAQLRREQHLEPMTAGVSRFRQVRNVIRSVVGSGPTGEQPVWAVTMVRNEADIIAYTVHHLLGQGVDRVVVADNLSDDATPAILADLAADPRVLVVQDEMREYYQGDKMTRLARHATRAGAAWIVPFDADEAWYPASGGTLAEWLRSSTAGVVKGYLENYLPLDDVEHPNPYVRFQHREAGTREHKVAFRANWVSRIWTGNHSVSHPGAVARGLRIAHVPYRSYAQMQAKVRVGRTALELAKGLDPVLGAHWRELGALDDAALAAEYEQLRASKDVVRDPIPYSGPSAA